MTSDYLDWHPDRAVRRIPGRTVTTLAEQAAAYHGGRPVDPSVVRLVTGTAPGELVPGPVCAVTKAGDGARPFPGAAPPFKKPKRGKRPPAGDDEASEQVVPDLTKAGPQTNGVTAAEDYWPNPLPDVSFDPAAYRDPPGTTSGSATPLASDRFVRRPGQQRHPSNGQYLQSESPAAGVRNLGQQPGGDRAGLDSAMPEAMVRRVRAGDLADTPRVPNGSPPSPIRVALAAEAASVGVRRLDLHRATGPAWVSQLARPVDPVPVSLPSPTLNTEASGTSGLTRVPVHSRQAGAAVPPHLTPRGPLADSITDFMNDTRQAAFGFRPAAVTAHCPGE